MPEDINTNIPKGVEKREFTGVWIPKEILDDSNLKAVDKILYAEISSFGQKGCWKKSEDLRNLTGVGVDAFRESCKRLRLGGYITEKRSFGRIIRTTTLGFSSKEKPITNEEENPCVERGGFYHRSGNPCDEQRENPRVHIENSIDNSKENIIISKDIRVNTQYGSEDINRFITGLNKHLLVVLPANGQSRKYVRNILQLLTKRTKNGDIKEGRDFLDENLWVNAKRLVMWYKKERVDRGYSAQSWAKFYQSVQLWVANKGQVRSSQEDDFRPVL